MSNDPLEQESPVPPDFSLADKERLKIENPRLKKLYDYLSEVAKNSYSDPHLLSNAVFSKCDLPLPALNKYLAEQECEKFSFSSSFKKLVMYFSKSIAWYFIFLAQKVAHKVSRQKFSLIPDKSLTLIDIFLVPEQIVRNAELTDRFFPGLEKELIAKGRSYAYAPKFSGEDNPLTYYKMFCLLKNKKRPVLTSFQLLEASDYLKMLGFILIYPMKVLRKINKLKNSTEENLLRLFLWSTLDHTTVKSYMRQLFGKRISDMNNPSVKCISWYENQPQDKNFYKGLRSKHSDMQIFGAQLYLWPATLLNLHADGNESSFGLIPNRILVNGTYYLNKDSSLEFEVGPSMRYSRLFQIKVDPKNKTSLLVLMPFFEHEIDKILEMIEDANFSVEIFVKFHPATDKNKYAHRMKNKMEIIEDDIYSLFERVGCVIGKSTGALVEATSMGIPVIDIDTGSGVSHNYLPEFGKGIIWEKASTGVEIAKWTQIFSSLIITHPELIHSIAEKHKEMFFCEPTDEIIEKSFKL
ncbi:MAG: hypothetical protein VW455_00895 [Nitrospinota bacterium]